MKKRHLFLLFALLIGVFFYRQIFLGEVIYCCDNLLINIPSKIFLIEELRQGRFPLWNPYIFSGSPFLADINLALLYPLNILYFFLPAFYALTLSVILNFFIAILGVYVFARSINLTRFGSILSAVVFAFSGTMVVYTNNVPMLYVASLLPWVLWGVHQYLISPSRKTLIIAASLASMQVIAGHPQLTYYTWLLVGVLVIWEVTRMFLVKKQEELLPKTLVSLFLLLALIFLVSGVQVLPFLEFVRESTRIGRGLEYATFDSLHPLSLVRFIIPNIVGVLRGGTAWARGGSVYGFTGVIGLLLALFTPKRNPYVRFFSVAAIASLLLAMGKFTPVFGAAYLFIPGVSSFRSPQHFLLLYTFSVAILAGFGLDYWRSGLSMRGTQVIRALGVIGSIAAISLLINAPAIPAVVQTFATRFPTRVFDKLQGFSPELIVFIVRLIAQNLIIVSAMLLAVAGMSKNRRPWSQITKGFFIWLIFMELFLFSRNNLLSVSNSSAARWLTTIQEKAKSLSEVDTQQFRVFTDPMTYPYRGTKEFGVFDGDMESAWQAEILRPNLNMLARLPTIDGYASLIYRSYAEYLSSKQIDPTGVVIDDPTGSKKKRLGVVPDGLPRIFLLKSDTETTEGITIETYTSNEVIISVESNEPVRLAFIDTNYPGWEAYVEGERRALIPFEKVFKSVDVPEGVHRVTFRYLPVSVRSGLGLTLVGIGLIFWAITRRDVPKGGGTMSSSGRRIGEKRLKRRI